VESQTDDVAVERQRTDRRLADGGQYGEHLGQVSQPLGDLRI
jgi:hypothetical protein